MCRNIWKQKDGWHQSYRPAHAQPQDTCPEGGCQELHQHFPSELESSSSSSYEVSGSQNLLRKGRWTHIAKLPRQLQFALLSRQWNQRLRQAQMNAESPTYLTRSLDIQVVKPFQDCNSGHHPNGCVTKVVVQHLNYSIQVQGHLYPLAAAWKERLVQCCNIQLIPPMVGSLQHSRGCIKHLRSNPH